MTRDVNGKILLGNDPNTPHDPNIFPLGPGVKEVDTSKPGIGFCYSLEDNALFEVTSNDDPNYQPYCLAYFKD